MTEAIWPAVVTSNFTSDITLSLVIAVTLATILFLAPYFIRVLSPLRFLRCKRNSFAEGFPDRTVICELQKYCPLLFRQCPVDANAVFENPLVRIVALKVN